ncbi:MAG: S8 family serine peptidase [Fimbriimonadaceae bacterium]|nr:S8 family serine peptidase [Fimbriimonadaceae bacterium]
MRKAPLIWLLQIGLAVLPFNALASDLPNCAPDAVLVAFEPSVSSGAKNHVIARLGLANDNRTKSPYFQRLIITNDRSVNESLQSLYASGVVRIAEPDWIGTIQETIPNDTRFSEMWAMRNTGQLGGLLNADIDATLAWDRQTGNPLLKVAIIDTGMSYNHVDLNANVWLNPGEIPGNGIDDDGNGRIDDLRGYDFVNNDGNPADDHGHGTHCAGTIGAVGNNGIGVAGVCWNVTMIPIKAFNSQGSGFLSNTVLAIDYARQNGAKVMSNSYAFNFRSQLQFEAIQRAMSAGIVFVAGSGNNGFDADLTPLYPAGFSTEIDNVISVGATNRFDEKASFSNYGLKSVDLFAPGVDILSTYPVNFYLLGSGTSMATPHAAGSAALLLSEYPNETPTEIRERLRSSADRLSQLEGLSRSGRLNINRAISANRTTVSGIVELQDLQGALNSHEVTMTLRASGIDYDSYSSIALNPSGEFVLSTTHSGSYELVVKSSHWLARKTATPVLLGSGDVTGLVFSLTNGDSDGDNEVGIGDYALLSVSFNTTPNDPDWDHRADLNGDEAVDIADYAILSANFGLVGD